ncbi:hypothetical protein ABW20_dc0108485 [Dactylellina cionopaga]|nr:hypothetical protein ABW20_dc0108485 [Dactylellina cionopaga]
MGDMSKFTAKSSGAAGGDSTNQSLSGYNDNAYQESSTLQTPAEIRSDGPIGHNDIQILQELISRATNVLIPILFCKNNIVLFNNTLSTDPSNPPSLSNRDIGEKYQTEYITLANHLKFFISTFPSLSDIVYNTIPCHIVSWLYASGEPIERFKRMQDGRKLLDFELEQVIRRDIPIYFSMFIDFFDIKWARNGGFFAGLKEDDLSGCVDRIEALTKEMLSGEKMEQLKRDASKKNLRVSNPLANKTPRNREGKVWFTEPDALQNLANTGETKLRTVTGNVRELNTDAADQILPTHKSEQIPISTAHIKDLVESIQLPDESLSSESTIGGRSDVSMSDAIRSDSNSESSQSIQQAEGELDPHELFSLAKQWGAICRRKNIAKIEGPEGTGEIDIAGIVASIQVPMVGEACQGVKEPPEGASREEKKKSEE